MAQQPQTPEEVFLPQATPPQDDSLTDDMALLNALADLGQTDNDAKVNVYRADAIKGNRGGAFLFSCSPDEFSLEKLRDEYGGGNYRVHVRANGGLVANKLVAVEEPKNKPALPQAQIAADVMQPITAMTQAMITGFENLGKLIIQSQQPKESRADMLRELLLYKEIFGASNQPQVNPLEFVKQGIDLAKELGAGGGKETGTMDVMMQLLDTFGKPIAETIANAQAQQRLNPPQVQPVVSAPQLTNNAVIAPVPASAAVMTESQPVQLDGDTMQAMRGYLDFLIAQAQAGNDVYTYAGMVLDSAPTEQIDQFIDRPDWLNYLAQFQPEIRNHELWFTQLRDAIKELLTDEPEGVTSASNQLDGQSTNALGDSNNS